MTQIAESLPVATLITFALGLTNVTLVRHISGRWITPAAFYWAAWGTALPVYWYVLRFDTVPAPLPLTFSFIYQAHVGAWVAFPVATLLCHAVRRPTPTPSRRGSEDVLYQEGFIAAVSSTRLDVVTNISIAVVLTLGIIALAFRLYVVGDFGLGEFLSEARQSFIEDPEKAGVRWTYYLIPLYTVAATLLGAKAAGRRPVRKQLAALLFGVLLYSLAEASRQKIFLTIMFFACGYLILLPDAQLGYIARQLRRHSRKVIVGLVGLVLLFQVFGAVRAGRDASSALGVPVDFLSYYALGISAVGPHLERVPDMTVGGELTFSFVWRWLHRFGLAASPTDLGHVLDWSFFAHADPRIAQCGVSLLGYLALDFGKNWIWVSMGLMMFAVQSVFCLSIGRALLGHFLAATCAMIAFYTIYGPWLFSGQMVLACLALAALLIVVPLRRARPVTGQLPRLATSPGIPRRGAKQWQHRY